MFVRLWEAWKRGRAWLLDGVWDYEIGALTFPRRAGLRMLRIVSLVLRGLDEDSCQIQAWALTSITLLSIVPFLAFVFSFGKSFGAPGVVEGQLRKLFPAPRPVAAVKIPAEVRDRLALAHQEIDARRAEGKADEAEARRAALREEIREIVLAERKKLDGKEEAAKGEIERQIDIALAEVALAAAEERRAPATEITSLTEDIETQRSGVDVVAMILGYVDRTRVEALGAIGFLVLLWTFLKTLGTVEASFNQIWGVQHSRPFHRKFTDYVSVSLVGIIALAVGSGLNVWITTGAVAHWVEETLRAGFIIQAILWLMPAATTGIGFSFIYFCMPNTRVRVDSAMLGGFIAALIFQLTQKAFIHFQVGVARYNQLYGAFATFPLFIFWAYFAWLILLLGAEIAFAHQHESTYAQEKRAAQASQALRERVAIEVAIQVAKRFQRGEPPPSADDVARIVAVPVRLVHQIAFILGEKGILLIPAEDGGVLAPARALELISIGHVIDAVRTHGDNRAHPGPLEPEVELALRRYREAINGSLGTLTLRDLAESGSAPHGADPDARDP